MEGPKLTFLTYASQLRLIVIFILLTTVTIGLYQQAEAYDLKFLSYFGGSGDEDQPRDIFVDADGNIFLTGGSSSPDLPTTSGVYDRTQNGWMDVFVAKFDLTGRLIWCTYLGGPNHDRAYAIEVDSQGYVYVAGRAGLGFPITSGVFQKNFQGSDEEIYGWQNAFVAKLSPDGSTLIWATYVGVGHACRDLAIDGNGDVYVPLFFPNKGNIPPSSWFANTFQKSPQGGSDCGAIKIKGDGTQVIWATWLGGSDDEFGAASIRVDDSHQVYIVVPTKSDDMTTTAGAFDRSYNGGVDYYVAKLKSDGSGLIFGTYFGGSKDEWVNTHNLALDYHGNAYVSVDTNSSNLPVTSGAFQAIYKGKVDMAVAKFSPLGALLSSTFIGGKRYDNTDGIYIDGSGNVCLFGASKSSDFPITSDAYQLKKSGGSDAVMVMLSADFRTLRYASFLGGTNDDSGRTGFLDKKGNLFMAGVSYGPGCPKQNAFQKFFSGEKYCGFLARFDLDGQGSNPSPEPTPLRTKSIR